MPTRDPFQGPRNLFLLATGPFLRTSADNGDRGGPGAQRIATQISRSDLLSSVHEARLQLNPEKTHLRNHCHGGPAAWSWQAPNSCLWQEAEWTAHSASAEEPGRTAAAEIRGTPAQS